jgi:dihydropteroate synthase
VTPDLSDGGQFAAPITVGAGPQMIAEGATSSTSARIHRLWRRLAAGPAEEELKRLRPVPDVVALGVPVSIDSMKSEVAPGARYRRGDCQRRVGPAAR